MKSSKNTPSDLEKGLRARNIIRVGNTYHFLSRLGGKVVKRSLETDNLATAKERAAYWRQQVKQGTYEVARQECLPEATVGDIFAAAHECMELRDVERQTMLGYIAAARRLLETAFPKAAVELLPASVFCSETLTDYQAARTKAAKSLSPYERNKAKNGAAREIGNARGLFSKENLFSKPFRRLTLPATIGEFKAAPVKSGKSRRFTLPDAEVIDRFHAGAAELKTASPGRWLALQLCANIGLRASEAAMARLNQFQRRVRPDGGVEVIMLWTADDLIKTKGSQGAAQVPEQTYNDIIAAVSWCGFILPGKTLHARQQILWENARWLRDLGWRAEHPNHELRKWYGARIASDRANGGIYAASLALRHSSVKITEQLYADYLNTIQLRAI